LKTFAADIFGTVAFVADISGTVHSR